MLRPYNPRQEACASPDAAQPRPIRALRTLAELALQARPMSRFLFPRGTNQAFQRGVFFGLGPAGTLLVLAFWYYATNKHLEVGYQPEQPVDYSHKLHAGELGMDCRYCHYTIERAAFAAVPPAQVCMNCHAKVGLDNAKLLPVRESFGSDLPIAWVRVHKLPEYVYFNHGAHLAAGVGCSSCHDRVDQMPRMIQREPLSMSWCLDCHRAPGSSIRPASEITDMDWTTSMATGRSLLHAVAPTGREVYPPVNCSGCHR